MNHLERGGLSAFEVQAYEDSLAKHRSLDATSEYIEVHESQ